MKDQERMNKYHGMDETKKKGQHLQSGILRQKQHEWKNW